MLGGGGSGSGGGGGSTTTPAYDPANGRNLKIQYADGLTDADKATQQDKLDKVPEHVKARLFESGTKVWVGARADETPGWAEYSRDTGRKSTDKTADGREYGALSFYSGARNELFISTKTPDGSRNVYAHELGHAADYQWTGDGKLISNDPAWIQLHETSIKTNPLIDGYYRGGPSGTNDGAGRRELFAEGLARYQFGGIIGLSGLVGSRAVAEQIIEIWKRFGVVK